jgi:hypothetical protein
MLRRFSPKSGARTIEGRSHPGTRLSVVFRLEQKTMEFLAKDYERPNGCPQPEDPGEHGVCADN